MISQSPSADTEVEEGTVVTVVISLGKEVVYHEIPDMKTMVEGYIRGNMTALNLIPVFEYGTDSSVEEGQCYAQDVPPGTKLPEGSVVKFYINRPPSTNSGDNAG